MSDEYDNIVDLTAFRKQREDEQLEKARLEKEAEELEEIEYMRYLLGNIMEQIGDPVKTGSLFYVPMTDDDYFSQYQFESGYNENGDYESTWEWDDTRASYYLDRTEEDDEDDI
jgi:hypothetical protein